MKVFSIDIGVHNMGLCAMELGQIPNVIDIQTVALSDGTMPVSTIVERLIGMLTEYFSKHWWPESVVIEQQMNTAPTNRALAYAAMAFFKTRQLTIAVHFIPPRQKFDGFKLFFPHLVIEKASSSSYIARKRHAITIANTVLKELGLSDIASFPGCTVKQDDAADAFLQVGHRILFLEMVRF